MLSPPVDDISLSMGDLLFFGPCVEEKHANAAAQSTKIINALIANAAVNLPRGPLYVVGGGDGTPSHVNVESHAGSPAHDMMVIVNVMLVARRTRIDSTVMQSPIHATTSCAVAMLIHVNVFDETPNAMLRRHIQNSIDDDNFCVPNTSPTHAHARIPQPRLCIAPITTSPLDIFYIHRRPSSSLRAVNGGRKTSIPSYFSYTHLFLFHHFFSNLVRHLSHRFLPSRTATIEIVVGLDPERMWCVNRGARFWRRQRIYLRIVRGANPTVAGICCRN